MNELPVEILVILLGIGAVPLIWLAMRFGRTIGIVVLVLGLLAVAILGAASLATQASANFQAAKATTEAIRVVKTQSTFANVGLGLLVLVLLAMVAGLVVTVVYLLLRSSAPSLLPSYKRSGAPLQLDNLTNVALSTATITAISQLLALQQEMAESLRYRWAAPRRRSPWYVSAPFLPRTDPSMMGAFMEDDSEGTCPEFTEGAEGTRPEFTEGWGSWSDEGGGGGDLWGVQ